MHLVKKLESTYSHNWINVGTLDMEREISKFTANYCKAYAINAKTLEAKPMAAVFNRLQNKTKVF